MKSNYYPKHPPKIQNKPGHPNRVRRGYLSDSLPLPIALLPVVVLYWTIDSSPVNGPINGPVRGTRKKNTLRIRKKYIKAENDLLKSRKIRKNIGKIL